MITSPQSSNKDGRATDSCFTLIGAHQCGVLTADAGWPAAYISTQPLPSQHTCTYILWLCIFIIRQVIVVCVLHPWTPCYLTMWVDLSKSAVKVCMCVFVHVLSERPQRTFSCCVSLTWLALSMDGWAVTCVSCLCTSQLYAQPLVDKISPV